jgi:hypothetical protein
MKSFTLLIIILISVSCGSSISDANEISIEENYHKKLIINKGKNYYFLPSKMANSYYDEKNFFKDSLALKIDDLVLFYDIEGNIIYQTSVKFIGEEILLECLNWELGEFYIEVFELSKIKELESLDMFEYRYYRPNWNEKL